jgi:hypothetical protein
VGKQRAWTDALVIVSIVSVGVVVAGLTHDPVTEPTVSGSEFVTEPIDSAADIPGCTSVESSVGDGHSVSMTIGEQAENYDNPEYPWFGGPKASAMSEALVSALPADIQLKFAGPRQSLVFQPIIGPGSDKILESTSAMGTLVRSGVEGSVTVSIMQDNEPIPPCIAGALDARQTTSDGTVVDTLDTWYEFAEQRTAVRSAVAYTPDGSRVSASTSGIDEPVLSVGELADMVQLPELRTTYPIDAGTPSPPMPCSVSRSDTATTVLTRQVVADVNTTLNSFWDSTTRPVAFGRPLGSLQLDEYDPGSACQELTYGTQTLRMSVTPTAGSFDHDPDRSSPGYEETNTTLPDGSVLLTSGIYVFSPTGWPQQTIALETTSGMKITVRASDRAIGLELLQSIAQTAAVAFP